MVKLGLVCSEFNYDITKVMEQRAKEHAKLLNASVEKTVYVSGAFDIPLAVKRMLESQSVDAVVTLGAVLEGETKHDEIVAQHASRKIADLSLEYDKPVALGLMGPGITRPQAQKRIDGYAKRAVESAVKLCTTK
ncbi:MAG: 6,7-dimethyl-8-ribityllumazine synthase [Candidatus Micrarchaeia archaeon]